MTDFFITNKETLEFCILIILTVAKKEIEMAPSNHAIIPFQKQYFSESLALLFYIIEDTK